MFIALDRAGTSSTSPWLIKRWDETGDPLSPIEIDPALSIANLSADGRLILARRPLALDSSGWRDWMWSIYSQKTGQSMASIRMLTSAAPFIVWNSILIYQSSPYGPC